MFTIFRYLRKKLEFLHTEFFQWEILFFFNKSHKFQEEKNSEVTWEYERKDPSLDKLLNYQKVNLLASNVKMMNSYSKRIHWYILFCHPEISMKDYVILTGVTPIRGSAAFGANQISPPPPPLYRNLTGSCAPLLTLRVNCRSVGTRKQLRESAGQREKNIVQERGNVESEGKIEERMHAKREGPQERAPISAWRVVGLTPLWKRS